MPHSWELVPIEAHLNTTQVKLLDPDQSRRSTAFPKKRRMSFHPRHIFNIEVVAIATMRWGSGSLPAQTKMVA